MIETDGLNELEAAAYCGFSRGKIRELRRKNLIPHRAIDDRTIRYSKRALTAWMAGEALAPTGTDGAPTSGQTGPTTGGHRRPFQRVGNKIVDLRQPQTITGGHR